LENYTLILIDLSQCIYSVVLREPTAKMNFDFARGMIYTTLLSFKKKFEKQYGEPVLAIDASDGYWREGIFEHYKAPRRLARKTNTTYDWDKIKPFVNDLVEELRATLPWKCVQVSKAEADDVIAVLAKTFGDEPTLIISSDKDYKQLQYKSGVDQYSSVQKKWIKTSDPKGALMELILEGDTEDGIPNLFSDSDTFVCKEKRQTPMTAKRRKAFMDDIDAAKIEHSTRFLENKQLIDFDYIPTDIQGEIIEAFSRPVLGSINKLYKVFIKHRMSQMMGNIETFRVKGKSNGICSKSGVFE